MKRKAAFLVLLAAVLWGSNGIFVKILSGKDLSGLEMTCSRLVISAVLDGIFVYIKDKRCFQIDREAFFYSFSIGLIGICGFLILYNICIGRVGMGVAGVLIYLMPVFVTAYSVLFKKERLTSVKILALVLNLVGCALVSGIASGGNFDLLGIVTGVLTALCYAFNNIVLGDKLKDHPALTKLFYPAFSAGIISLTYLLLKSDIGRIVSVMTGDPKLLLTYFLWAVCCSLLPYYLFNVALSSLDLMSASLLSTFEPVAAVLFGIFLFQEKIDLFGMIGVLFVLISLILVG